MDITSKPKILEAGPGGGSLLSRPIPVSVPEKLVTIEEFLRAWNDPDRPRLTPEEAADFEADIKAVREEMNSLPMRLWD